MKWISVLLLTVLASVSLALTPVEKNTVTRARDYLRSAEAKASEQQRVIEELNAENERLDQLAQGQQNEIVSLSGQIDKSHANEVALAGYNAYAKPIIDQVNSYWGLGAFAYGFKVLAKHLFILIAVLAGIALVVFVLSFFFPFIVPFLRAAMGAVAAVFRTIGGMFRKK